MNMIITLITFTITIIVYVFELFYRSLGVIFGLLGKIFKLSVTNQLKLNKLKKGILDTINFYK